MNIRRIFLVAIILSSLACNFVTRAFDSVIPTVEVSPTEIPPTSTSTPLTPAYIPPQCNNQPLATIPAATLLVEPTSILQTNPDVSHSVQLDVFNQVVSTVNRVYVYPDFNGHDWNGIVSKHRAKIDQGLSTADFYAEIETMINELGDDHSTFESPVEVGMADAQLAGKEDFVGIGIFVLPMIEKGSDAIIAVFPDSPAAHGGLKPHDSVTAVDGLPVVENGVERPQLFTGPECSAITVTVQSPGEGPRTIMLLRQRIQGDVQIQASLLPTSDGSRIGYIFLPTFFDKTIPKQVADALNEFGKLDGLILDNRMNGGGSSEVLEPILSYFANGTLGDFISKGHSRHLTITPDPIQNSQTVPLIVLVGDGTASFGEVFAGVLQDSSRAKVVGKTTNGNVETLHGYTFPDGSRLWIAEETFVPKNSKQNWEQTGIIPDVEAYADWDTFTFENDPSIAAAVKLLGH